MGKVDCFTLSGLNLWFWSHDHNPPHFHAASPGKWEVKVNFLESDWNELFEVIHSASRTIPKSELKKLAAKIHIHRAALLEEWENKVVSE